MKIKDATGEDLDAIARCHKKAFPHALSSAMGHAYIKRMLGWYLFDPKAFLFFLEENDQCIGYCGGMLVDGKSRHGSASSMTQYSFGSAVRSIILRPWLFFHPEFLSRYPFILRNIGYRITSGLGRKVQTTSRAVTPHAGLVVIGVDVAYHGRGIGAQLLQHFDKVALEKGYSTLSLTVLSDNEKAIKSYLRNGWMIVKSGERSISMEKNLRTQQ